MIVSTIDKTYMKKPIKKNRKLEFCDCFSSLLLLFFEFHLRLATFFYTISLSCDHVVDDDDDMKSSAAITVIRWIVLKLYIFFIDRIVLNLKRRKEHFI